VTRPVPAPLFPVPKLVERPWGGSALREWGRNCLDSFRIGESWELGAVADCDSLLEGGLFDRLSDACDFESGHWLGLKGRNFPLLVKLIDARETLSLQVHPSHDGDGFQAKNECWVVLSAPEGAFLYAGTAEDLPKAELMARLKEGDVSVLAKIPVVAGDVVVIPAGTVHAITAGLVIAEIQQSSDTTYRLFDWGRVGLDGKPRELHLAQSESCLNPLPNRGLKPVPIAVDPAREILCATPWFAVSRVRPGTGETIDSGDGFRILMVLEGPVELSWEGGVKLLERGRTVLLPAGMRVKVAGGLLLESWEPSWERDILGPVLCTGRTTQDALTLTAGTFKA
jgi:mannose-6-phosphate isomerase